MNIVMTLVIGGCDHSIRNLEVRRRVIRIITLLLKVMLVVYLKAVIGLVSKIPWLVRTVIVSNDWDSLTGIYILDFIILLHVVFIDYLLQLLH